MSKYIIDTGDYLFTTDGVLVVGFDCDNKPATFYNSLDNLEELNSDYINEHYGDLQDTAYQRGLDDAWEAARKIADMWTRIDNDELLAIFGITERIGHSTIRAMFEKQTANEAMLELEAYEEKQKADDKIEVGDEVEWDGDKYVVTYLNYNIETSEITDYDLLAYDGSVVDHVKKCAFTKTGKHYDIASILEAMRK